ncbi:MAG: DUF222 domain-containing protein [Micrococcales bacterium]|nr:DUF222 domain-containing protein [Micrococcales bacterium]OJX67369.1 MAG: hypothetical protein BGO94_00570 [Micrococcales bacterium 72-143]
MPVFTDALAHIGDLSVPHAPAAVAGIPDAELLSAQRAIAEVRRRLDATAAVVAGEIAHRSRRELGHTGLAATHGQRSAEGLISQLAGTTTREARTLLKAAELLPPATSASPARPAAPRPAWVQLLGDAVASARVSVEQAELIRTRVGAVTGAFDLATPREGFDAAEIARLEQLDRALAAVAEQLLDDAQRLSIEQLASRAAAARDDLDLAGVAARERKLHDKRYLAVVRQLDGMTRIHGLLDPESAAIVVPILDAATSPRRGGPRFVSPDEAARADGLVRDARTTDQLTLDTVVELIRIGSKADDGRLLGEKKPAVRILVTRSDLEAPDAPDGTRVGAAFFEGQADAVSIDTAERYICASGAIPIQFDGDGRVLNLGREQRLFSEKQRLALAARDGGCLMCDRPPSWCEAHHIDHWDEHHGRTDIDDGVLLCRHCHLLLHNRAWRIRRTRTGYHLERPDGDGVLRSTPLPTRSRALQRLRASA